MLSHEVINVKRNTPATMTMSPTNVAYMWASVYFFTMENVVRAPIRVTTNPNQTNRHER